MTVQPNQRVTEYVVPIDPAPCTCEVVSMTVEEMNILCALRELNATRRQCELIFKTDGKAWHILEARPRKRVELPVRKSAGV
jgi:hypothetical protein